MGGIGPLFHDLMRLVPPSLFWPLVAVLAVLGLWTWWNVMREKQIAGLLRRAAAERGEARHALLLDAYARAGTVRRRWGALTRAATARGLQEARATGLDRLRALGGGAEARRIEDADRPPAAPVGHPDEAAAAVERLLEAGAVEAARVRLDAARKRYPTDAALTALSARLTQPVSGAPGSDA